jgi:NAD(P)-dependent dehydrogenase (short-subunit alcohol dehydrogenase family)
VDYYKNKHVYITGGSSGIGLALARRLFSYDANLTIIARNSKMRAGISRCSGFHQDSLSGV